MSRSKKNWDHLVDYYGNYYGLDREVGVERILAGDGIVIDPEIGIGEVTVTADPDVVVMKGDGLSVLDNDVGYLTGVDNLNDIGDVNVPNPGLNYVLTWNGSAWVAKLAGAPDSFLYRGQVDVSVDHPEPDPKEGWTYIHNGPDSATPLPSWVGIESDLADTNDLVVYAATGWTLVKGVFDQAGFRDLKAVNSPTPQAGMPGGYLEYDEATATFTYYPTDTSWVPDFTDDTQQPGTLDDRYVNKAGDTMSGDLDMQENDIKVDELFVGANLYLTGEDLGTNPRARHITSRGNGFLSLGLQDTATDIPVVGATVRRHTNGLTYLHVVEEPVLDEHAVPLSFLQQAITDLDDKSDGLYVKLAGDTMSGDLSFSHDDAALTFEGANGKINSGASKELTIGAGGSDLIHAKDNLLTFQSADAVFNTRDGRNLLKVGCSAPDRPSATASYYGLVRDSDNLVHKKYVDDNDDRVLEAVDQLELKVDNLDLGILEIDADAKYLQEIKVNSTTDINHGLPARVEVFNKNEFDFYIPAGQKGQKGLGGSVGTKGQPGPRGEKGDTGEKGESIQGEKGVQGNSVKGQKGQKGGKGSTGGKGDEGSGDFVVRGNKGSTIRIWYSNSKYYIAGTS